MRLVNGCAFKPSEWRKQGVPIIRIQNLNDPDADFNYFQGAINDRNRIVEGDVLFAWSGTLGSSFGARIWGGPDGVLNQHIFKVIADERVFTKHYSYLIFKRVQEDIEKKSHGFKSSFVHVKKADIDNIHLPIPPLHEQRAIAAALSDVDALLAKLDQFIAKKRDLKQAAMQQILTGQTRLPGFSGAWEVKRLRDVLTEIGDGATPSTAKSQNFGGSIAWVVIDDIKDEIWFTRNTLTDAGLHACAAKLWPVGTLILSTGATIGEVGIAKTPLATKQGICGLVFDLEEASPVFMKFWFAFNKPMLLAKAQGSSIKEVRAPTLVQFEVLIPAVSEQTAIATVLSDMDAELAALEARRDKTRALKQGMMQELLTGRIRLV